MSQSLKKDLCLIKRPNEWILIYSILQLLLLVSPNLCLKLFNNRVSK